jgi:DNA topoisomerase-1
MQLVIVESPTKSRTLQIFLGKDFKVLSSYGHIRDLPEDEFGVEIEKDFKPKYIVPQKSKKTIQFLKGELQKAKLAIVATDEDREGEAIAWHLTQILNLNGGKPYQRIVFHEITKSAIDQALKNPRKIDMDLVDAQQARRILDRIVGYKLSPFLWKKIARGLSAGRVQSVAVRLVVEREREIKNFIPQEYWEIAAELQPQIHTDKKKIDKNNKSFLAKLIKKDSKTIPKLGIKKKRNIKLSEI